MLHGFRFALGLLAASALTAALLPGCKSDEASPRQQTRDERSPQGAAPPVTPAPALEAAPQVTVQASQQGLVVADQSGKESLRLDTTSGKPPEDWPSEVPLYPGAKIDMSMKLARGFTLTMETPDASAKVSEYYRTQLARLPQTSAVDLAKGQTLMWSDASKPLHVTLALSAGDGGATRATLLVVTSK